MYAGSATLTLGVPRLLAYNLLQLGLSQTSAAPQTPSPAGGPQRSWREVLRAFELTVLEGPPALAGDVTTPPRTGEPLRLLFDIRRLRPCDTPSVPQKHPDSPAPLPRLRRLPSGLSTHRALLHYEGCQMILFSSGCPSSVRSSARTVWAMSSPDLAVLRSPRAIPNFATNYGGSHDVVFTPKSASSGCVQTDAEPERPLATAQRTLASLRALKHVFEAMGASYRVLIRSPEFEFADTPQKVIILQNLFFDRKVNPRNTPIN